MIVSLLSINVHYLLRMCLSFLLKLLLHLVCPLWLDLIVIGWKKYAHVNIGVDSFGISCAASKIYQYFKITPSDISETAKKVVEFYKDKKPIDLVVCCFLW